jgi:argininosuccinate lyase
VVGELVAHCLNENKALLDLDLEELKKFHPAFEQDVFDDLSMIACVEKRKIPVAPAPEMVQKAIDSAREQLNN